AAAGALLAVLGGRGGGGLGLGPGAVQKGRQVRLAVLAAEAVQQKVQLLFFQGGAVLFVLDPGLGQGVEDLLDRKAGVLCKICDFIFYDHSLISSSYLMAPQACSRS